MLEKDTAKAVCDRLAQALHERTGIQLTGAELALEFVDDRLQLQVHGGTAALLPWAPEARPPDVDELAANLDQALERPHQVLVALKLRALQRQLATVTADLQAALSEMGLTQASVKLLRFDVLDVGHARSHGDVDAQVEYDYPDYVLHIADDDGFDFQHMLDPYATEPLDFVTLQAALSAYLARRR